ncbi:MAG: FitA-like ribbon-helix-helix domain-containing protein [Candidatus Binatia bacterium]
MPVNLSIKNVPEELAGRLRERARRNHRSLQGELRAMLEEHLGAAGSVSADEAWRVIQALGLKTPAEAARMIRSDRDARARR